MIAATRSCGVTGLNAFTREARLTSDVLIVVFLSGALVARELERLARLQDGRRQPVGRQNRLDVRPRIAGIVGGGDAPDGVPRRHDDRVAVDRSAAVSQPSGDQQQPGGQHQDAAPASTALGSWIRVSGPVLYEHVFVYEANTNRCSRPGAARTSVCIGRTDVLACPRFAG